MVVREGRLFIRIYTYFKTDTSKPQTRFELSVNFLLKIIIQFYKTNYTSIRPQFDLKPVICSVFVP